MAENVTAVQPAITREQVSAIARDPELRKLRPGTEAYQAAFTKKFGNDDSKPAASATASTKTEVPANKEATGVSDASDDDKTVDGDDAISANAQKRIAKLVKERNLEKAERAKLEARIAELEKAGKTPVQAEKQATAEAGAKFDKPKPKFGPGGFTDLEEYNEALFDWKTEKREFENEQKSRAKQAQESAKTVTDKFWDEGSKLEKELGLDEGDFKALVSDFGFKIQKTTVQAIFESPLGPRIAYEMANLDDSEKERVEKMTAIQQVAYVGKLEAKFESRASKTTETTLSAAKAPGKPLRKGAGTSNGTTLAKGMNFRDYEAARKAQRPDLFRR